MGSTKPAAIGTVICKRQQSVSAAFVAIVNQRSYPTHLIPLTGQIKDRSSYSPNARHPDLTIIFPGPTKIVDGEISLDSRYVRPIAVQNVNSRSCRREHVAVLGYLHAIRRQALSFIDDPLPCKIDPVNDVESIYRSRSCDVPIVKGCGDASVFLEYGAACRSRVANVQGLAIWRKSNSIRQLQCLFHYIESAGVGVEAISGRTLLRCSVCQTRKPTIVYEY